MLVHRHVVSQFSPPPLQSMSLASPAPFPSAAAAPARSHGFRGTRCCRTMAVTGNEVRQAPAMETERVRLDVGYAAAVSRKNEKVPVAETAGLEVLYEDGFGTASVKDYFDAVRAINEPDGGPPRWFCPVECGAPLKGAPLLLFLPGSDGTGMGLILHHKSLGKVFELRCLHIPVDDRTPFEGLVRLVEDSVRKEHEMSPGKPIYLLGDSFGGCLALAVAARNPAIDLVLILVNPASSFGKSQFQQLLPFLESLPSNLHSTLPYLLSFVMGDPIKMAMASISTEFPHPRALEELSNTLVSMLPLLSEIAYIIPRDTLLWKLKLIKSGSAYVNSRLHAVKAEVLMLASGKDNLLPSGDEADRLHALLQKCKVRYFKDNGHTLLLEDGVNLLSVIKGTSTYRLSKQYDHITDYLYPTRSEFNKVFIQENRLFDAAISPVVLSTDQNGRVVRGLSGVPDKGPVILVGYHMLMGFELTALVKAFLEEKKIVIRGMAHPFLFSRKTNTSRQEVSQFDTMTVFGALPVNPINMYKLLSRESFVLLYPGGAREALHRKGEEYKLFWPDQPEFVRMAARFGATIVPFGVVGEDDIAEVFLDYNDQKNIPFLREWIEEVNEEVKLRVDMEGEVSNQQLYLPGLLPKLPGRFYYLFGKPFETRGKDILKDRKKANAVYKQIKSEIEGLISYLKGKREKDPYRSIVQRALYQASGGSLAEVPTFEP